MKQKKVVVTGGGGFIGSHLCARLVEAGSRVYCIDNLRTGRLENLERVRRSGDFIFIKRDVLSLDTDHLPPVDEVYHLACCASPPHYQADPIHTMMTCVAGTRAVLQYATINGAKFLLASTSEVYGDPAQHPQKESYLGAVNSIGPRACYDEGKRAAEALTYDFARKHNACVRVARIFNTYGPAMRADDGRVISNFITQALSGAPLTIFGTGAQTRSFCYVDDLVAGLVKLMERPETALSPVNLGNPNEYTVRELAGIVCRLTGVDLRFEERSLPEDDPRRRRPDISRAQSLLNWRPTTKLEQGLRLTIDAFREERDRVYRNLARKIAAE